MASGASVRLPLARDPLAKEPYLAIAHAGSARSGSRCKIHPANFACSTHGCALQYPCTCKESHLGRCWPAVAASFGNECLFCPFCQNNDVCQCMDIDVIRQVLTMFICARNDNISLAATLDPSALEAVAPQLLRTRKLAFWAPSARAVMGRLRRSIGCLTIAVRAPLLPGSIIQGCLPWLLAVNKGLQATQRQLHSCTLHHP